jgi:hypothetical protein
VHNDVRGHDVAALSCTSFQLGSEPTQANIVRAVVRGSIAFRNGIAGYSTSRLERSVETLVGLVMPKSSKSRPEPLHAVAAALVAVDGVAALRGLQATPKHDRLDGRRAAAFAAVSVKLLPIAVVALIVNSARLGEVVDAHRRLGAEQPNDTDAGWALSTASNTRDRLLVAVRRMALDAISGEPVILNDWAQLAARLDATVSERFVAGITAGTALRCRAVIEAPQLHDLLLTAIAREAFSARDRGIAMAFKDAGAADDVVAEVLYSMKMRPSARRPWAEWEAELNLPADMNTQDRARAYDELVATNRSYLLATIRNEGRDYSTGKVGPGATVSTDALEASGSQLGWEKAEEPRDAVPELLAMYARRGIERGIERAADDKVLSLLENFLTEIGRLDRLEMPDSSRLGVGAVKSRLGAIAIRSGSTPAQAKAVAAKAFRLMRNN